MVLIFVAKYAQKLKQFSKNPRKLISREISRVPGNGFWISRIPGKEIGREIRITSSNPALPYLTLGRVGEQNW